MQRKTTDWLENVADQLVKQGFAIQDDFLTPSDISAILSVYDSLDLKKAGIGKSDGFQVNKSIRGDLIRWIDPATSPPAVQTFLEQIEVLISYLNRTCFLGIRDYETHFTKYPAGTFYARHLDQFRDSGNRKISFICYLNQQWSPENGGQLRLYLDDRHQDILPLAGRLACFVSSEIEHEVLICHKTRYSLTGWMLNQPKTLGFLP